MTQIAIVIYPSFTALDFIGPYEVLRMLPDAEVRFLWHETGPIAADSGVLLIGATHTFDETPQPDVVLVPCVGFTAQGWRLGYGGGYFDRYLAAHPGVTAIGVAWQVGLLSAEQLQAQAHDQALMAVVTEKQTFSA